MITQERAEQLQAAVAAAHADDWSEALRLYRASPAICAEEKYALLTLAGQSDHPDAARFRLFMRGAAGEWDDRSTPVIRQP